MIQIKDLTIKCRSRNTLDLHWELEDTTEDVSNYKIDIYRSQAPSEHISEYELVAQNVDSDIYYYSDSSLEGLHHGTRKWYYTLDVKNTSTGENKIQPKDAAYVNDTAPNLRFLKILKQKRVALRKRHAGRDLVILKRRTWGERSEEEWDDVLFTRNSNTAPEDNTWGTGWKNGYFKPIGVRGMINSNPEVHEMTPYGEFYPSDVILNILNRPPIKPQDVVVDDNNKRYRVEQVRPVEMLGTVIEQQAQMSTIHPDDEIYGLNIDLEAIAEAQGDDSKLNLQSPGDNFTLIEN